jgi:transposase
MERTVKEKKIQKKYEEEFKRQAVELVIHSGKTQAQIARELGVSGYSLNLWKKAYLKGMEPAQLGSRQMSPEQMVAEIKRQQKEIEYLRRQREILKKAMSILGEEPNTGMR